MAFVWSNEQIINKKLLKKVQIWEWQRSKLIVYTEIHRHGGNDTGVQLYWVQASGTQNIQSSYILQ